MKCGRQGSSNFMRLINISKYGGNGSLSELVVLACLQQHFPFLHKDLSSLILMGPLENILCLLGMGEYFVTTTTILLGFMLDNFGILVITWWN